MVTEELLKAKEEMLEAREKYNHALCVYKDIAVQTMIENLPEDIAYYCKIDGEIRRIKIQKSDYYIIYGLIDSRLQTLKATDVESGESYNVNNYEVLIGSLKNPTEFTELRKYIYLNVNLF